MVELTEESLTACLADLYGRQDYENASDYFIVHPLMVRYADRIVNKWKGKRAVWLRGKR